MGQAVLSVETLPDAALEAASAFHAQHLPQALELLESDAEALVIVLPSARYDHADWRRALAKDLARGHAPRRVNVIGSDDRAAIEQALAYLEAAPGVTGHYLPLNSTGAGDPLDSAS